MDFESAKEPVDMDHVFNKLFVCRFFLVSL
jgi:hypothetical protein